MLEHLRVCVCVEVFLCVQLHLCVQVCGKVHCVQECVHKCMCVYKCACAHRCMSVRVHVCERMHVCTGAYVYACVLMCGDIEDNLGGYLSGISHLGLPFFNTCMMCRGVSVCMQVCVHTYRHSELA